MSKECQNPMSCATIGELKEAIKYLPDHLDFILLDIDNNNIIMPNISFTMGIFSQEEEGIQAFLPLDKKQLIGEDTQIMNGVVALNI